jgi:hypothetical protein
MLLDLKQSVRLVEFQAVMKKEPNRSRRHGAAKAAADRRSDNCAHVLPAATTICRNGDQPGRAERWKRKSAGEVDSWGIDQFSDRSIDLFGARRFPQGGDGLNCGKLRNVPRVYTGSMSFDSYKLYSTGRRRLGGGDSVDPRLLRTHAVARDAAGTAAVFELIDAEYRGRKDRQPTRPRS